MSEFTRTAQFERAAADKKARRYPVIISTETPVRRLDSWGREYSEVLRHDAASIDLSRAPLPLIESHDRQKVNIGRVADLRIDGDKLRGILTLGNSARAQELADDIESEIVDGISIGYSIETQEESGKDDSRTITATRWMPFEVSVVAVPADIRAGINRSHTPMSDTNTPAIAAERERVLAIQGLARQHQLDDEFTTPLINAGATIEAARARALEVLEQRSGTTYPPMRDRVFGGGSGDDFRDAATDALLIRSGVQIAKPHAAARDLAHTSVPELARTCLSRAGVRHGQMAPNQLLERALSTSDFPLILDAAANKALRLGYMEEASTHSKWTKRVSARDFKTMKRVILGSAPNVAEVLELGEYTYGAFDEDGDGYAISKFGKIIKVSWEALVNDDTSAFSVIPAAMGQAARRNECDKVYNVILQASLAGQTMADSVALFHANHGNIATGAGLQAALDAGRLKMRRQTGVGGAQLNLAPRFLIVPPDLESQAERLLAAATRVTTSGVESANGWTAGLEMIVESRLTNAAKVYLAASPSQIDTVEVANLEGQAEPQLMSEDSFNVDARSWKVRHTVGTRALDYRGLVRVDIT